MADFDRNVQDEPDPQKRQIMLEYVCDLIEDAQDFSWSAIRHYSISSVLPWFWCIFKTPGETLKICIFEQTIFIQGFKGFTIEQCMHVKLISHRVA